MTSQSLPSPGDVPSKTDNGDARSSAVPEMVSSGTAPGGGYTLRIDHSFVREAVVRSIAPTARSFDTQTIVEPVDTASQAALLDEIGGEEVQDFPYSKAPARSGFRGGLIRHDAGPAELAHG